ncbi:MAG TPA: ThuA domain-containing protein [Pirellulaceae bacterium]|nr:ThuA domain-containing protein [Pirellulaceae bacterium]HMO91643.1 ThuA domain-containing protein [Pirellulaceae bacterium]HMP68340.1 ThuA domain-containing protein [Pirellulaceae bacterium]
MNISRRNFMATTAAASAVAVASSSLPLPAPKESRKLVMIAGKPSHGPGAHEHNAGVKLFERCLQGIDGLDLHVVHNGYPEDDSILDSAHGILCYADGGSGHPLIQGERLNRLSELLDRGVGLFCLHYAVEVPKGDVASNFRNWIGGCYEHEFSCNPMWIAEFAKLPDHPVCNGVKPFKIHDEWYFNMRFRDEMKGVQPLLSATPTDETRDGPYVYPRGPYKHIQESKGRAEHLMWCVERDDRGRGVGFTGGHFHANWQNDDFRKIVLNALLWVTGIDVPKQGVESAVSDEAIKQNLDPK